jgi:hypothetical protein
MTRCYDCRKVCTKDYKFIDVYAQDGNLMRVAIHNACHIRATKGGEPVEPEGGGADK